jgi:hypothetical protein
MEAIQDHTFLDNTVLNLSDSFSTWYIVEEDIHFYPENDAFNSSEYTKEDPIRVWPNTTQKDIWVQLIQRLQSRSTEGNWWESDWTIVDQIEQAYGVNWDEVRDM